MALISINRDVESEIADRGFAWIPASAWSIGSSLAPHWQRLSDDWESLEPDRHLQGGATFRLRRYGRYSWSPPDDELSALPHESYFQPQDENSYAGGVERNFAPILPETVNNPFLSQLVRATFNVLPLDRRDRGKKWEVRIHQIRIVASADQPGLPAPEGIHQDGTDFLTLHLVRRHNIVGGESTIYGLDRSPIQSCTLREPLDSLILEDSRVLHGVTPVHPADGQKIGKRDLFGIDFIRCLAPTTIRQLQ